MAGLEGVDPVHPVQTNAVFARLASGAIERLLAVWPGRLPFHVSDPASGVCRWMCASDTEPEDVDSFAAAVAAATG